LKQKGVERIIVGGLATDYCVLQTVLDGRKRGFEVKVLKDAVRAVNLHEEDGKQAVLEMEEAGAKITSSLEVIKSI